MSDDSRTQADFDFPFRPSGADWDRLTAVVQDVERRKTSGMDSTTALSDVADARVIGFTAVQRSRAITSDDDKSLTLADCWAEGFVYGVLFELAGGTALEHEPVKESTMLKHAMRPERIPIDRPGAPVAPDWATMQLVMDEIDALFGTDLATEQVYNKVVDVYAMVYLAVHRVGMTFPLHDEQRVIEDTDSWVEGFLYGVLFQRAGGTVRMT